MKTYVCHRCGQTFEGRLERCPRCAQLFVYERNGVYYDALGNVAIVSKRTGHIKKIIRNKKLPR